MDKKKAPLKLEPNKLTPDVLANNISDVIVSRKTVTGAILILFDTDEIDVNTTDSVCAKELSWAIQSLTKYYNQAF